MKNSNKKLEASEDEVWVKETLFQNLQKNGYNVNIDFKDFVPGI
jgi:hypothetical protein